MIDGSFYHYCHILCIIVAHTSFAAYPGCCLPDAPIPWCRHLFHMRQVWVNYEKPFDILVPLSSRNLMLLDYVEWSGILSTLRFRWVMVRNHILIWISLSGVLESLLLRDSIKWWSRIVSWFGFCWVMIRNPFWCLGSVGWSKIPFSKDVVFGRIVLL